jgi:hypothetical protein
MAASGFLAGACPEPAEGARNDGPRLGEITILIAPPIFMAGDRRERVFSTRPFGKGAAVNAISRGHETLGTQAFQAIFTRRRFPNECSGFCQVCSWLNCSALCPNRLRAKMISWKQTVHHLASFYEPHSTGLLPRSGAVINPTTKTRRHKELTHFRAPRAEMRLLRVLVSSSSLVSSCLVFLGRRPSKNRLPKKLQKRTHCGEIRSIFKEFIF